MNKLLKKQNKFYAKNLNNFNVVIKDAKQVSYTFDYEYNCMSYALGRFTEWGRLNGFHNTYSKDQEIAMSRMEKVFADCCCELEEIYGCRRISYSGTFVEQNERIIAFRIGFDDFHFARLNSDGVWTHKPGRTHIREMSIEELFDAEGWSKKERCHPYTSPIAFFAVQI